ncbi:unnamed protein product, partial [Larinioides sclopetarius]
MKLLRDTLSAILNLFFIWAGSHAKDFDFQVSKCLLRKKVGVLQMLRNSSYIVNEGVCCAPKKKLRKRQREK